jgi:branched-chain amino acid transport system ATP-binding protein
MTAALETVGVSRNFGGIVATDDVTLAIEHGARHALIGPNGAGKTTFVNLLSGVLRPSRGRILLDGEDITQLKPFERARRGIARTFQINQLFPDLTPLETIGLAVSERLGSGSDWWRLPGTKPKVTDEIVEIVDRFRLAPVMHERTATLPYGRQRLLEIALACASKPRVLLLDEPAAGVPTSESAEIFDTLAALPSDVSVLLIEHDMDLVFRFASRITVLVDGTLFADGPADVIAKDPRVKAAYLGEALDV